MKANWELELIKIVDRELMQLELLIANKDIREEGVELGDIHAQISRLGGLTDLANAAGLPLTQLSAAKLKRQNEKVMQLVRSQRLGI